MGDNSATLSAPADLGRPCTDFDQSRGDLFHL